MRQIVKLMAQNTKYQTQLRELARKNKHGQYCLSTLQRIIAKLATKKNTSKV